MENILNIIIVGTFNLLFFYLGMKVNNKSIKEIKEKNELLINPVKRYKTMKENKKIEEKGKREQEELKIMLENIENYDGTNLGQIDIP